MRKRKQEQVVTLVNSQNWDRYPSYRFNRDLSAFVGRARGDWILRTYPRYSCSQSSLHHSTDSQAGKLGIRVFRVGKRLPAMPRRDADEALTRTRRFAPQMTAAPIGAGTQVGDASLLSPEVTIPTTKSSLSTRGLDTNINISVRRA